MDTGEANFLRGADVRTEDAEVQREVLFDHAWGVAAVLVTVNGSSGRFSKTNWPISSIDENSDLND